MKILAVNFQRLGDILMTVPLLNGIKKKYPNSSLHYFCFEEFRSAAETMEVVDHWHFLPREKMFEMIRSERSGIFDAGDTIDQKLRDLDQESFDLIINLSHTEFSSQISGLIQGKERLGSIIENDQVHFSSEVFKEMDSQITLIQRHLLDWFRKGFQLSSSADWTFSNRKYEKPILSQGRKLYLFQILSSEEKKAWTREKWSLLFQVIRQRDPFAKLKMLCAPNEIHLLSDFAYQNEVELLSGSLKDAYLSIKQADYFITLDTSTKHLANDSDCKVIELSLGSSNYLKQSIYKSGAIILSPNSECYPCLPKERCPHSRRVCSIGISVSDVVSALDLFEGKEFGELMCNAFITRTDVNWRAERIDRKGEMEFENARMSTQGHSEARTIRPKDY